MLRDWKITRHAAALLLACLAAGPVYATCTNPAGNEGDQIYNKDYHTWQYCNGTAWVAYGGGIGAGAFAFISTQTASSSASLQFTNLPTSYNTLFLNCGGLLLGTASVHLYLRIGESSAGWETTGHYTVAGSWVTANGGNGGNTTTTQTDLGLGGGTWGTTFPTTIQAYISSVGSSSLYKNVTYNMEYYDTAIGGYLSGLGGAYWNSDTNAITELEVVPSSGNITSGTCSLYGMN